ncbi:MAG: DUF531 family protein [Methanobacteriota archaeon]
MPGRLTIGLYNSYDPVRFHEAHRRALARAGPLALAFDANLATFGFPFSEGRRRSGGPDLKTPVEVAEFVADSTTIGEGGEYFVEIAKGGRFAVFDFPKGGFPPQLGVAVLATRRPAPKKTIGVEAAAGLLRRSSALLVFGLGPRGVPSDLFEMTAHHLDVTGRGLSLETATAMGATVAAVATAVRRPA